MAFTLAEQTTASVATPATDEDSLYFDSADDKLKYKDDTGTANTLAVASGKLSQFAATTSVELAGVISDETGSGALVFGTSPTLTNPVVGTQSYGDSSTKGASTAFVQAALATSVADGNSSTALTVNWTTGNIHTVTLTGNCTFTFTAPSPALGILILKLTQDGTGSRTVTWPGAVHWPGGTAPTLTTTASKIDIFTFYYDGSVYYGSTAGLNFA